ncbi:ORC-CDC6 family AAA ATPase [Chromobacterium haemolyticum]|uniref:ORC-CDC6 family AAA ATPase n=1 Tax=Chromobacterium haemolyticum TaxID=394935 RepID=UPI00405696FB
MNDSKSFVIRTEDLRAEEVLDLFAPTERDLQLVSELKSPSPLILEGSRGTGKSFLLRVCEQQQLADYSNSKVVPVYVSFVKSSLLATKNEQQFQHWMLARLSSRILRTLYQLGLLAKPSVSAATLAGGALGCADEETPLERIAKQFEESFKQPGGVIEDEVVPDVEAFRDATEDLCKELGLRRINVLFDEAIHIFRPEQQRQFFTLFRDLRSPYMTCNAAVYPGVTSYGPSFEAVHDAQIESLNRDVHMPKYRDQMREIVLKQSEAELQSDIEKNGENFDSLAFAVSGNPRLLLKTVAFAGKLRSSEVQVVLKDFYRTAIWSEHSALAERYPGHKELIDWGRIFVEQYAISDANQKNENWKAEGKSERTCYFWVHRDIPEAVKEAFRLLAYTGVITKLDSGVVATRREVGTRYAINIGCLAAPVANPITYITDVRRGLTVKRFTEYGQNFAPFLEIAARVGAMVDVDLSVELERLLAKPVTSLDLTSHQLQALDSIGILTIRQALMASEATFRKASYIGPVRSRMMMNVVTAAVLEFLSG